MSAYITLATPMTDCECLVDALVDVGFVRSQIDVHDRPVPLVGYGGTAGKRQAHVVIRRLHLGASSNDLGFELTPTGYRLHVSDFDRARFDGAWMTNVSRRYQHHDGVRQERLEREAREAAELEARRVAAVEAKRREEARRQLVEAQRVAVLEKAKQLGYRVEETRQGDAVRLVLVRRTY